MGFKDFFEATTPQQLDVIASNASKILESQVAGTYQLYLVQNLIANMPAGTPSDLQYQISFQKTSPQTTIVQAASPNNIDPELFAVLNQFKTRITQWKQRYGKLTLASMNPQTVQKMAYITTYLGLAPIRKQFTFNGQNMIYYVI